MILNTEVPTDRFEVLDLCRKDEEPVLEQDMRQKELIDLRMKDVKTLSADWSDDESYSDLLERIKNLNLESLIQTEYIQ